MAIFSNNNLNEVTTGFPITDDTKVVEKQFKTAAENDDLTEKLMELNLLLDDTYKSKLNEIQIDLQFLEKFISFINDDSRNSDEYMNNLKFINLLLLNISNKIHNCIILNNAIKDNRNK